MASGKTTSGVKIEASRGGLLQVTVTNDQGNPIAGAEVSISHRVGQSGFTVQSGVTDDKGAVALHAR